jgi:integrase
LSVETGTAPTVITRDNFHLSKPIRGDVTATHAGDGNNPLSLCTDPNVLRYVEAATSTNTVRAYDSDLAHFLAWGGTIPAEIRVLAQYVAVHGNTLSAATLARRLVAIRRAHVLQGMHDPTTAEVVRLTLRGVRRVHGRPQRRVAPLKIEHLLAIASVLGCSIRDVRDLALLLIGFASAFRRSELIAINCDWIKRDNRGFEIALPRSKTDQEGTGRSIAVPRVGGPICPAGALENWLQASKIGKGPLFRQINKAGKILAGRLSPGTVGTIVKHHVAKIGLDPKCYLGHSLRAGFATSAAAAGLSIWQIKRQTGHVSDEVVGRYIREVDQFETIMPIWSLSGRLVLASP